MKIIGGNFPYPLGVALGLMILLSSVLAEPKSDEEPHRRLKKPKCKDNKMSSESDDYAPTAPVVPSADPDFAYPDDMPRPPKMWAS